MTQTAEFVLDPERNYEIINGKPVAKALEGARHGGVCARLLGALGSLVMKLELGGVYASNTSFKIGSDERLPDISFVSIARFPEDGEPEGIWLLAPDLAVEVASQNDFWQDVLGKMRAYFAAGVREVWLVAPESKEVYVYTDPESVRILSEEKELTSDLLPGFRCKLSEIFDLPGRRAV